MQHQKMSISKKKFRIGDLAKELKLKKYIIRFWEKEFDLESDRSEGGQRFYTQDDLNTFSKIKELLYTQGYTISGAKKQLNVKESRTMMTTNIEPAIHVDNEEKDNALQEVAQHHGVLTEDEQEKTIIAARKEEPLSHHPNHDLLMKELQNLREQLLNFKKLLD